MTKEKNTVGEEGEDSTLCNKFQTAVEYRPGDT